MKIQCKEVRIYVGVLYATAILLSSLLAVGGNGLLVPLKAYASTTTTYVVQSGDSLYTIGLKFGVSWQSIASANNISSPYTIYPGQVLVIPSSAATNQSSVSVQSVDTSGNAISGSPVTFYESDIGYEHATTPSTFQANIGQTYSLTIWASTPYHFLYWADTGSTNRIKTVVASSSPATFVAVFTKLATYTVQAGDSLYTIGLKFGVSWQSIASANNISSPYTIYPGQVLVIPTSLPTPSKIATGNSVYDQFDSYIVTYSQSFGITDPMIVKSMIMQESAFQPNAVSPDIPCGIPIGWTADQSKSFGLMQVTPACVQPSTIPNLTQDTTSSQWATSWFNPSYNINRGVQALSTALSDMKNKFPGCTSNQYTLMAVGAYNSGDGSIFGCGSWNDRAGGYITSVLGHYQTFAQMAGIPYPY